MTKLEREVKKKFGSKVRSLRDKRGFSQEQFAKELEIDRSYISGIERGVRNPTLTMMARIAKGLSVRMKDLLPI